MKVVHQDKNCSGCPDWPVVLCPECDKHNRIYHNYPAIRDDGSLDYGTFSDCWHAGFVIRRAEDEDKIREKRGRI